MYDKRYFVSMCKLALQRPCTFLLLVMGTVMATAQTQRTIKGTVVDENNQTLIGATIKVDGSPAVITNLNGQFSALVPTDVKSITVSYIGYKTQTVKFIKGKDNYRIHLSPDDSMMDEVVVIGYGTAKRGNLTGAVASVKSDLFEDQPTDNIANALQGQLAGVDVNSNSGAPGEELNITIRGNASLHAEDTPLYIVDGIPVDDLAGLNNSDIASIDILKDASSSAIYGSRGANGVVLITTKDGGKNNRLLVTATASFGIQQINKKIEVMSPQEWISFRTKINNLRYIDKYGTKGASIHDDYTTRLSIMGGEDKFDATCINDPRWTENNYGGLSLLDWQEAYFRLAPIHNYNIAVAQSSAKSKFRASLGYYGQQGIAVGTGYHRLSLRVNYEGKLNNIFTVGGIVTPLASWSYGGNVNGRNGTAQTMLAMCPVAEPEAGFFTGAEPYPRYQWASSDISPVAKMEQISNNSEKLELQMSGFVRAQPIKGLKLEVLGTYRFRSQYNHTFTPSSVISGWSSSEEGENSTGARQIKRYQYYILQGTANYDVKFGKHNLSFMSGASVEHNISNTTAVSATGFADNSQLGFSQNQETVTRATASFGTPGRLLSFFGRAQYDFDDRYIITGSLRHDGSAKFGRNRRWCVFPSVGATWRVSEERFWPENNYLHYLKVRLSWGLNGNNSLQSNAAVGLMSEAGYSIDGNTVTGYAPTTLDNVDLGWEKTRSWNIGFDLGLLKNRLSLSIDIYRKLTDDMLYKVTVPSSMGLENNEAWYNMGSIVNKGIEFELSSRNIVKGPLKWTTSFNIGYNANKVLSLGNANTAVYGGYNGSNTHVFMVGHPMRSFIMYDAVGVYQTEEDLRKYPKMEGQKVGDIRYRDVNRDGKIDENDKTFVGKARPDATWGISNKLGYKNFDLSISVTGQWGGYLYSLIGRKLGNNSGSAASNNLLKSLLNSWYSEAEPGDGRMPNYLSTTTSDLYDSRWLFSSDFVKLKNITLGYNVPLSKKNSYIKKCRTYFSIQNLFTWDNYDTGYSPEASTLNNGTKKTGYDYGSYPMARTYVLGVNMEF